MAVSPATSVDDGAVGYDEDQVVGRDPREPDTGGIDPVALLGTGSRSAPCSKTWPTSGTTRNRRFREE